MPAGQFPLFANTWGERFKLLNREPTSVKNGELVGADGIGWDPDGNGSGLFARIGGAWIRVSGSGTTIGVNGDPTSAGDFNLADGNDISIIQSGSNIFINSLIREYYFNDVPDIPTGLTVGTPSHTFWTDEDRSVAANIASIVEFDFNCSGSAGGLLSITATSTAGTPTLVTKIAKYDTDLGTVTTGDLTMNGSGGQTRFVGQAILTNSVAAEGNINFALTRDGVDTTVQAFWGTMRQRSRQFFD